MEKLSREKEVVGIYISGHPLDDFKIEMKTFCNGVIADFENLETMVNQNIKFGGVVTEVQHRISKQGKGWAMFTIEDYTDSFDFRIFGEDYLKFRHFLVQNSFVHVQAFVKEGWVNRDTGKKGDPRIQFNNFQLLHDVMGAYAKKLSIQLNIRDLKEDTISDLQNLFRIHDGNNSLNFLVYDNEEKLKLTMPSRKQKVKISQELLNSLAENDIKYKLN